MEFSFGTTTYCYFGPWFVPLARLLFLPAIFVLLVLSTNVLLHPAKFALQRILFFRYILLIFVAGPLALMSMAVSQWFLVDRRELQSITRPHASDPLHRITAELQAWYLLRPTITFALLLLFLALLRYKVRKSADDLRE